MKLLCFSRWMIGAFLSVAFALAHAQVPQYGANVNHDQAKAMIAAAVAEANNIKVPMAIAITDTAGTLVAFVRMDNVQIGSIAVAQDKAVSAAIFRRPTKVFQDIVAGGGVGLRILTLRGATAVEGGIPIVIDGKIAGAIGVSGGSSDQDGVVAQAGLNVLKK